MNDKIKYETGLKVPLGGFRGLYKSPLWGDLEGSGVQPTGTRLSRSDMSDDPENPEPTGVSG